MDIGRKIYNLRMQNNIKQHDFANIIGVSKSTMSNYERNYSTPDIDTLIRIADYFNVSIDYILDHDLRNGQKLSSSIDVAEESEYSPTIKYSDDEKKLFLYFNRLNDENKDSIKGRMVDLYREQQNILSDKSKENIS